MKTCGECKHFGPGTTTYDDTMGKIHFCNKEHPCYLWNINGFCKEFEDLDYVDLLKKDIEDFRSRETTYANVCRRHGHPTEAEVTERRMERILKILEEKLNDLQSS